MSKNSKLVIYARYSTDLQSKASCEDQVRQVREALTRLGIDHSNALVLADEAISGTKADRPNFQRLLAMIEREEVSILAVDEQSRLTRGFDATKIIQDLQFRGGRFISITDSVDSSNSSWKMIAGFKQIANNAVVDETAARVRRGQKGNLIQDQSAGDNPFGYEAYYLDPEAALRIGNGPKPKKGVRINEVDAQIVREIFRRFISGESMSAIARDLTSRKTPRGNRVKDTRWSHAQVHRILENSKYVGEWVWGRTKTIRNGGGKTRQAKTPREDWFKADRPHLRIVDQSTWEVAQAKLKSMHDRYGYKEGQRKRGPAIHHSVDYPTGLLNGLLYCMCGARMHVHAKLRIGDNEPEKYFECPVQNKDRGSCTMASHVPADKAEQAVMETILARLTSYQDWQTVVLDQMKAKIQANSRAAGSTVTSLQHRQKETKRKLDNLFDAITEGNLTGQSAKARVAELETELDSINSALEKQNQLLSKPLELPDENWIAMRFQELSTLLMDEPKKAAILIRKLIPRITANHVIAPGKSRGYTQIRFSFNRHAAIQTAINNPRMETFADLQGQNEPALDDDLGILDDFVIDLGGPTQYDALSPKIAAMRAAGATWKTIQAETGIAIGNLYNVWARYIKATTGKKPTKSKGTLMSNDISSMEQPDKSKWAS